MLRNFLFIAFLFMFFSNKGQSFSYHIGIKSIGYSGALFKNPPYKNFGLGFYVANIDTLPKMFFLRLKAGIEYENINVITTYNPTSYITADTNKYKQNIGSFCAFLSVGTRFQAREKRAKKEKKIIPYLLSGVNMKIYFASYSRITTNTKFSAKGFRINDIELLKFNDYFGFGIKTKKRDFTVNFENFIFGRFLQGLYYRNDDKRYTFKQINLIIKI